MDSLVERLRAYHPCIHPGICIADRASVDEAADRIEKLENALRDITVIPHDHLHFAARVGFLAKSALEQ